MLTQFEQIDRVVDVVIERLDELARSRPGIALLTTIPGVGVRIAEAALAYVNDPKRFARMNRIGAYFGLVPSQDAIARVNRLDHITRHAASTKNVRTAHSHAPSLHRTRIRASSYASIAVRTYARRVASARRRVLRYGTGCFIHRSPCTVRKAADPIAMYYSSTPLRGDVLTRRSRH